MKFCCHCGKELLDEAVICPGCGFATNSNAATNTTTHYITKLSNRVKINGIIWICIASLQIMMAVTIDWFFGIIGILNLISAIKDLNYSKEVLTNQSGIVQKFEPLTVPIITLVYNIVFGGIIGVVGSINYLVGIRSYVLNNKEKYLIYDIPNLEN